MASPTPRACAPTQSTWQQLRGALFWRDPSRARLILAGEDPATNRDVAAWRRLGGR